MKKIITLIAAAAMLAVSCQKEAPATSNTDNAGSSTPAGKLTATFVQTKVTYTETPEMNLQPAWEVGDKIIGFDDAGNTYTLSVASVSAETATLSGSVPDGALHLIYKSGAQASDISSKSLAIDYKGQAGDKTMPAVMLAEGTVTDGSCDFTFANAGAIIGISAVNGVPSGATISKITIEGANLSAATVALDGTALKLTATPAATDAISTATLSGITVTDANGTLSSPIFIAVPAGAVIAKVSATTDKGTFDFTLASPSTLAANQYSYVKNQTFEEDPYNGHEYVEIGSLKWATCNIGASSPKDYGWYFFWGGTTGYVPTDISGMSCKWVSAKDGSELSGGFCLNKTPYQTGNTEDYYCAKFTKYLGSTTSSYKDPSATDADALKTVLDPDDDAAHVNWGGSWRMPTSAEFQTMRGATYWAWDSTDQGYYVFMPGQGTSGAANGRGTLTTTDDKTKALLFFPAAGYGDDASLYSAGSIGYYWSSSLNSSTPFSAYTLRIFSDDVNPQGPNVRMFGQFVRPVLD